MKTKGIRILDKKDHIVCVNLSDVLDEVSFDVAYVWSILFLDGVPNPKDVKFVNSLKQRIDESKVGLIVSRNELELLSSRFFQMYEILVIGCKNLESVKKYKNDKIMYQSCDLVVNYVDCSFWEVFSKDFSLIKRLSEKFKDVEFVTIDNFNK